MNMKTDFNKTGYNSTWKMTKVKFPPSICMDELDIISADPVD